MRDEQAWKYPFQAFGFSLIVIGAIWALPFLGSLYAGLPLLIAGILLLIMVKIEAEREARRTRARKNDDATGRGGLEKSRPESSS